MQNDKMDKQNTQNEKPVKKEWFAPKLEKIDILENTEGKFAKTEGIGSGS